VHQLVGYLSGVIVRQNGPIASIAPGDAKRALASGNTGARQMIPLCGLRFLAWGFGGGGGVFLRGGKKKKFFPPCSSANRKRNNPTRDLETTPSAVQGSPADIARPRGTQAKDQTGTRHGPQGKVLLQALRDIC